MNFQKTVTITWPDPNPPGSVVDFIVTRADLINRTPVKIGTSTSLTFADVVTAPGVYTYGVAAHNGPETSPESNGQIALLSLLAPGPLTIVVS